MRYINSLPLPLGDWSLDLTKMNNIQTVRAILVLEFCISVVLPGKWQKKPLHLISLTDNSEGDDFVEIIRVSVILAPSTP